MSCEIAGNGVGSVLLLDTTGFTFFLIMGLAIIATSLAFLVLKEPELVHESTYKSAEDEDMDQSFWETTLETLRFTVSR